MKRELKEDALKHLHLAEYQNISATVESLAGSIEKSREEASVVLLSLKKDALVRLDGVAWRLTDQGRERALQLVRAHRLYETYLAERTGEDSRKWHEIAEAMEHKLTPEETDDLAHALGHPRFDPHGDPIPTKAGSIPLSNAVSLAECENAYQGRIDHIEDEPESVYAKICDTGLAVGMRLRILEQGEESILLNVEGRNIILSRKLACNISLVPLEIGDAIFYKRLSDLKSGESALIRGISRNCLGAERRRLLDLGVVPGTKIQIDMRGPFRSPIAYQIRGTVIALRLEQSEQILIEKEESSL